MKLDWELAEPGLGDAIAESLALLVRPLSSRRTRLGIAMAAMGCALAAGALAARSPGRGLAETTLFLREGPDADRSWVAPTRTLRSRIEDGAWPTASLAELARAHGLAPRGGSDDAAYARAIRERVLLEVDRNEFAEPSARDSAARGARIRLRYEGGRTEAEPIASRLGTLVVEAFAREDLARTAARSGAWTRASALARLRYEEARAHSLETERSMRRRSGAEPPAPWKAKHAKSAVVRAERRLDELARLERQSSRARAGDRARARWVETFDRGLVDPAPRPLERSLLAMAATLVGSAIAIVTAMALFDPRHPGDALAIEGRRPQCSGANRRGAQPS